MNNTPKIWPWLVGFIVIIGIFLWYWFGQMPSGNPAGAPAYNESNGEVQSTEYSPTAQPGAPREIATSTPENNPSENLSTSTSK